MGKPGRRKGSGTSTAVPTKATTPATRKTRDRFELQRWDRQLVAALKVDIDSLALQFCAKDQHDLSLDRFGELFMSMELYTIFLGQLSNSDLVEFSEYLFIYCSRFMFGSATASDGTCSAACPSYVESAQKSNTSNLVAAGQPNTSSCATNRSDKERIFGVYLCYTLYFLQPSQFVVPIAATPAQLAEFREFIDGVLLPDEHFQALYCFHRLVDSHAFVVMPFEKFYNPLLQRYTEFWEGPSNALAAEREEDPEESREFGQLHALLNSDLMQQLHKMHEAYLNKKARLKSVQLPQSVQILYENPKLLVERVLKDAEVSLMRQRGLTVADGVNETSGVANDDDINKTKNSASSRSAVIERRNRIRENAYAQAGQLRRDRRHRLVCQGVDEATVEELWPELNNTPSSSTPKAIKTEVQSSGNKRKAKRNSESGGEGTGTADHVPEAAPDQQQNHRRRRRSRSRTAEPEVQIRVKDPVEAQIMRELDQQQLQEQQQHMTTAAIADENRNTTATAAENVGGDAVSLVAGGSASSTSIMTTATLFSTVAEEQPETTQQSPTEDNDQQQDDDDGGEQKRVAVASRLQQIKQEERETDALFEQLIKRSPRVMKMADGGK